MPRTCEVLQCGHSALYPQTQHPLHGQINGIILAHGSATADTRLFVTRLNVALADSDGPDMGSTTPLFYQQRPGLG
ncbi:uncharacterized [Tachysurus ichikawai]